MAFQNRAKEKCRGYLLFVVMVAAFGGFLFGYHTAVISGALSFLTSSFHLSIFRQGVVVSILLLGGLLGALVAGSLADRFGRKRAIILTALLFILGAAINAYAQSWMLLLLGRLISGLGVGIISVAAPLYLAEVSPPNYRGAFVSLFQLAITLGILASFIVDYFFAPGGSWRWMFAMGIVPAIVQMFALFFIPETPSWLFRHGKDELALSILGRFRKDRQWMKQVDAMKEVAKPQRRGGWKMLFSHQLRSIMIIGILLSLCQQITGINTVIYYAPKIFGEAGFATGPGAILATVVIGIINVVATLFAVWLLDRAGRRVLLLAGVAGMAISLGFLSFAFFTQWAAISKIAVASLMAYVAFFAIGLGAVTWVILSEIYPLKIRGKAMTVALFANWASNCLISLIFPDLIDILGPDGTFLLFSVICFLSFWFVYGCIPETKGKSLEEIESLMTAQH